MMRGILTIAAALSLLALGCDAGVENSLADLRTPTFGKWDEQKIWAEPNRIILDSPVVITTRCLPLVEGKGHIHLNGGTSTNGIRWHILEPVDTVMIQSPPINDFANTMNYPVIFHANEPLEVRWRVQFNTLDGFAFNAGFLMDSLFLADGPGMVSINSPEARAHSIHEGFGYNSVATAYPDPLRLSR